MPDDIEVQELRTLSVSKDGSAFRMGVRDVQGRDAGLVFPSEAVRILMMSLFRVGDPAFKRLLGDDCARLVYPVEKCELQASPGSKQFILIVATPDGFEAAFAIDPATLIELARTAHDHTEAEAAERRALN